MADDDLTPDLSFMGDTFKTDEGYDVGAFQTHYEDLSSFKTAEEERKGLLPKEPGEYAFGVPDDHVFPEGFDPALLATKDDDGNDVDFDINSMVDSDDPDLPLLQTALHKHGASPELMGELASILANRELRGVLDGMGEAEEQKTALGPNSQNRIATVTRALKSRLPEAQSTALLDSITSADGLRAFEGLMRALPNTTTPAPGKEDLSDLPIRERIAAGLKKSG
jgi:hypothetical protein